GTRCVARLRPSRLSRQAFPAAFRRSLLDGPGPRVRPAWRDAGPRLACRRDAVRSETPVDGGPVAFRVALAQHAVRRMGAHGSPGRDDRRGHCRLQESRELRGARAGIVVTLALLSAAL